MERLREAYDFAFYAYYRWFQRQKEHPPRANELYAWAVLSLNGTFAANSIQSALFILGIIPASVANAADTVPNLILFGWPYPVFLVANFRYFLVGSYWREIAGRFDGEDWSGQRWKHIWVAIASTALFFGSFGLAFCTM